MVYVLFLTKRYSIFQLSTEDYLRFLMNILSILCCKQAQFNCFTFLILSLGRYRISSNKRRASNNHRPLISAAPLGIYIEISASL